MRRNNLMCAPLLLSVLQTSLLVIALLPIAQYATAEYTVFFGEDFVSGNASALRPNSDQARSSFHSLLSSVGIEDFESFSNRQGAPLAVDFAPDKATLSSYGGALVEIRGSSGAGRFATSGHNYVNSNIGPSEGMRIEFTSPQSAFGFYGTDIGDFRGQMVLNLAAGGTETLNVPHTVNGENGSALYYGVIGTEPGDQFSSIEFVNDGDGADHWGFDDMTIGRLDENVRPKLRERETVVTPNLPDTEKLVVWVHGCCEQESNPENLIVPKLKILEKSVPGGWGVYGHDWTDKSGRREIMDKFEDGELIDPGASLAPVFTNAVAEGLRLGAAIAGKEYKHVHLIGHSAGSLVIEWAAKTLELASRNPFVPSIDTHTTFLDPPDPWFLPLGLAQGADWSDNYSVDDPVWFTFEELPGALNVDVGPLFPTSALFPSNKFPEPVHDSPVDFYLKTATTPNASLFNGYGFPLSREGGGAWPPNADDFPTGEDWVVLGETGTEHPNAKQQSGVRLDAPITLISTSYTKSESTLVDNGVVTLPTSSAAWINIAWETAEPVNFVLITLEFLSEIGAEGFLAAYWDGEVIGSVDERFSLDGQQEYQFWLPGPALPGTHGLAFRLDPYTEVQSIAQVSNIRTGYAGAVPEPNAAILLLLIMSGCVCGKRVGVA